MDLLAFVRLLLIACVYRLYALVHVSVRRCSAVYLSFYRSERDVVVVIVDDGNGDDGDDDDDGDVGNGAFR